MKQLVVGDGTQATLQIATIRDWPAMRYRGLSDDLSRGPVGTLEFQKKLVRTLATTKTTSTRLTSKTPSSTPPPAARAAGRKHLGS